jgi:hypothetical protein
MKIFYLYQDIRGLSCAISVADEKIKHLLSIISFKKLKNIGSLFRIVLKYGTTLVLEDRLSVAD